MTERVTSAACPVESQPKDSRLRRNWAKLRRNKAAVFGGILLVIYLFTALLAPVIFPGNPSAPNLIHSLEPPAVKNLLGTDELEEKKMKKPRKIA